jgi:hypothetical protein
MEIFISSGLPQQIGLAFDERRQMQWLLAPSEYR